MNLHELQMTSPIALARALEALTELPDLQSCIVDREKLRIRFEVGAGRAHLHALIERMERGGDVARRCPPAPHFG